MPCHDCSICPACMRAGTNQPFAPKQGEDGVVDLDPQEEMSLDPETNDLVTKRFVEFLSAQACPATPRMHVPAHALRTVSAVPAAGACSGRWPQRSSCLITGRKFARCMCWSSIIYLNQLNCRSHAGLRL